MGHQTFDLIAAQLAVFTDAQRSLAWSPEPPYQSTGAHDCRPGGDCGLDFNYETPRARWIQARYRYIREQKRLGLWMGNAYRDQQVQP